MMNFWARNWGILAALPWIPLSAHGAGESSPVDGLTTDGTGVIESIVVTATKRSRALDDIAQSIAVLDGSTQRLRGQQRLEDIQSSVANVTFTTTSNSSQIFVRGIGNTFINAGGDPGVAFYQDGAYVSDARTINTSMFDVERVEVLRGPQGALYGRNAVGGAINVVSARPALVAEGAVDAVVGNDGLMQSEGYVTGPMGSPGVAGRISYLLREHDGYTANLLDDQPGAPDGLDDTSLWGLRGQLALSLPGNGELNLLVSHYDQDDDGPALAVVTVPEFTYPAEALYGATPTDDPRSVMANVAENELRVSTVNVTLEQPVGDLSLTVVGNYRDGDQYFLNDCDGTEWEACRYSTDTVSEDLYIETYLASPADQTFQWIIGGVYQQFDQDQVVQVPWQSLAAYFLPGVPTDVPFFISYDGGGELRSESYAVYADVRWEFSPGWAVASQVRYGETTKKAIEHQTIPSFGVDVSGFRNETDDHSSPFKLALERRLDAGGLLYLSYTTANKDGAINIGALQTETVEPEEARTWELGHKATYFGRRLELNAALFHTEYENLQITQVVGTIATLTNAPESTVRGIEIDVRAYLTSSLQFGASLGYLDAEFDEFFNSRTLPGLVAGPLTDLSGNRLPYVPEYTANLDLEYRFAPLSGYEATLAAQYAWRSRTYFNEFGDNSNSEGAGAVVNVRGSLQPLSADWQIFGYINNLSDRTYQTGSTIYSGLLGAEKAVNYAPPRQFGVGLSYSF